MQNGCIPGHTYLFRWFRFTLPPSLLCFPLVSLFSCSRASQIAASGVSPLSISPRSRTPQGKRSLSYLPRKHFCDSFLLDQFGSPCATSNQPLWSVLSHKPTPTSKEWDSFHKTPMNMEKFCCSKGIMSAAYRRRRPNLLGRHTQQSPFYLFCSHKLTTELHRVMGRNTIDECKVSYSVESPE